MARRVGNLPPITLDEGKKEEIIGINENLEAAIRALEEGRD
jgi:hypothetical protein